MRLLVLALLLAACGGKILEEETTVTTIPGQARGRRPEIPEHDRLRPTPAPPLDPEDGGARDGSCDELDSGLDGLDALDAPDGARDAASCR